MMIRRMLSTGSRTRVLPEKYKALKLDRVADLPHKLVVPLSWQQYKPKHFDPTLTPVVLLHGFMGLKQNYGLVGRKISELTGHPVYGVDLRNHGALPQAAPHTYLTLADDVLGFLKERQWDNVILGGHSMGAKAAMLVALKKPLAVLKLVVIDNSPVQASLVTFTENLEAMGEIEAGYQKIKDEPDQQQLAQIDQHLAQREPDASVRRFMMSNYVKRDPTQAFRLPVLNFLKHDVLDDMGGWPPIPKDARYDGPTLIMKGAHSPFILPEFKPEFDALFPNNTLKEYDSGHWVVQEQPEAFVRDMVEFIGPK